MNLRDLIDAFRDEGYTQANAEARVCQDIILKAIDESAFADHPSLVRENCTHRRQLYVCKRTDNRCGYR